MFKLDLDPTFDVTVYIPQPGRKPVPVRIRYNYLEPEPYRETFQRYRDQPAVDWLACLVNGWDTNDKPGQWQGMPMPYSIEALHTLAAKQPRAIAAMIDAYQHEMYGVPLKN